MECMEAKKALKSSFFSEFGMKSANPQGFCDDLWCVAGINGVLPAEDFSVDEFFDLSGEDFKDAAFLEKEIEEEEKDAGDGGRSDSGTAVSGAVSGDELSIPADDLQELELWSHLMDDSVSELPPAYPVTDIHLKTGICQENRFEPVMNPLLWRAAIPTAFPVRPRTKRPRKTPGRFLSDSSSSSGLSSPVSTLFRSGPVHEIELLYGVIKPGLKKPKKKPVETGGTRRCSHCQVTKTPQWRAGPMGPKSLCNACGVRFKSGRLFPEYRPACSPTFSTGVHSNSHRKVLEMRKKKEMVESRMDLGSVISSC